MRGSGSAKRAQIARHYEAGPVVRMRSFGECLDKSELGFAQSFSDRHLGFYESAMEADHQVCRSRGFDRPERAYNRSCTADQECRGQTPDTDAIAGVADGGIA